jgi:nitrate reductase delta subunit
MLGEPKEPDPVFLARVERVQSWTRQRFRLPAEAAVLVSEMACTLPGCPPLETVVAFWTQDDRRHQFKLYKPMKDLRYDDIGWLIGSMASHEGASWDCC